MKIYYSGYSRKPNTHPYSPDYFKVVSNRLYGFLTNASSMGPAAHLYARIAGDTLERYLSELGDENSDIICSSLTGALDLMNQAIQETPIKKPGKPGSSSCSVGTCIFRQKQFFIMINGDISCYLVRENHVLPILMTNNGNSNYSIKYIDSEKKVGIVHGPAHENDCFIFLSGDIIGPVLEESVIRIVKESDTIHEAAQAIVHESINRNGSSNVTALLIYVDSLLDRQFFGLLGRLREYIPLRILLLFTFIAIIMLILLGGQNILDSYKDIRSSSNKLHAPYKLKFKKLNHAPQNTSNSDNDPSTTPTIPGKKPPKRNRIFIAKPTNQLVAELYQSGLDQLNPVNNDFVKADQYFRKMLGLVETKYTIFVDQFSDPAFAIQTLNRGIVKKLYGFILYNNGKYTLLSGIYENRKLAEQDVGTVMNVYQHQTASVLSIAQVLDVF